MNKRQQRISIIPLVLFFFVLVVDSALLVLTHTGWKTSQSYYIPLRDQIAESKLALAESHLWLEEYLDGDASVDLDKLVLAPVRMVILDAKNKSNVTNQSSLSLYDANTVNNMQYIVKQLEQYHQMMTERIDNKATQGIGSVADVAFDALYHDIEADFLDLSNHVYQRMLDETKDRNSFFIIALVIFILVNLSALAALLFYRKDKIKSEARLYQQKELAEITLASISDGVITTNAAGYIQHINLVASKITQWDIASIRGGKLTEHLNILNEDTRAPVINPLTLALETGSITELSNKNALINENGDEIPIEDSAAPIRDRDGNIVGGIIVFRDVTAKRALNKKLEWEASHDSLTEIFNRNYFKKRLEEIIKLREVGNYQLFFIDLDNFKPVNDTAGHLEGDEVLRSVAFILRHNIRSDDIVARLGGDEFALLLSGCDYEHGKMIARSLVDKIRNLHFEWNGDQYRIGASIGHISFSTPIENIDFAQLIKLADDACHTAKNRGKNTIHSQHISAENLRSLPTNKDGHWINKINQALEKDLFELFVQHIVPYGGSALPRYEVLIRLKSEGGYLPPNLFLPVAQRYRLMQDIDYWVINTLFQHIQENSDLHSIQFNVNITAQTLEGSEIIQHLTNQLASYPAVNAHQITFEITETSILNNLEEASNIIHALKKLGFTFALDDFGTGVSTFSYLKYLPVDIVKIDGSFVRDLIQDPVNAVTVRAIQDVCKVLKKQTVAEYVESEEIFNWLAKIGVTYAQGYYIHEPSPISTLIRPSIKYSNA